MKKLWLALSFLALLTCGPGLAFAAGSVVPSVPDDVDGQSVRIYTFTITADASAATVPNTATLPIDGWIDAVLAAGGRGAWTFAGPNEPGWVPHGDNGATYLQSDGIHYSDAGMHENAAQWKTALGY